MIRQAPFSFFIVCVVVGLGYYFGFHKYYADKLTDSDRQITQWKSDTDYWKDVANRAKQPNLTPDSRAQSPPSIRNEAPTTKKLPRAVKKVPSDPPLVSQSANAPYGIAITGSGLVSNPTVNNYVPPQRVLTVEEKTKFISALRQSCPFEVAVRPFSGNEESMKYADQISAAITEAGCKIHRAKFLYDTAASYGILLVVHDTNKLPMGADALAGAFAAANIKFTTTAVDFLEPDLVYVMVNLNTPKPDSKPQL